MLKFGRRGKEEYKYKGGRSQSNTISGCWLLVIQIQGREETGGRSQGNTKATGMWNTNTREEGDRR